MNKARYLLVVLLFFICCTDSVHYTVMQRADSLMDEHLDSAYQLIKTINPDELSAKDNAYYSLLLTTAQYKKIEPIPSDSVIDIAVQFYTTHFDQDKLIRSLMYKGGVLADLNYSQLALLSYKEAEKIADTTDYMTCGLLNFRLGELYQNSFIKNDEHIERYKLALKFFNKANHCSFENNARKAIGQLYTTSNYDSAYFYLTQALESAKTRNDIRDLDDCHFHLSRFYNYYNTNLKEAKNLALAIYDNHGPMASGNDFYYYLATLYYRLGVFDSAGYYSKYAAHPSSALDSMRYYMMQEEFAKARNDYKMAYNNYKIAERIADSLVNVGKGEEYYVIDKQFNHRVANDKVKQLTIQQEYHISLIVIISLLLIIVFGVGFFMWLRKRRLFEQNQRLVDQLQTELITLQSNTQNILEKSMLSISHLNKTISERVSLEDSLKSIILDRMQILRNLINIKYQFGDKPETFFKQFDKIVSVNKKSTKECNSIISIANQLNDNVIEYIDNECQGGLSYGDKLILSLVCLEFSPIEMTVFLNCPNTTAMYSQRHRLGKKLKTSSLETYITNTKQAIIVSKMPENSTK